MNTENVIIEDIGLLCEQAGIGTLGGDIFLGELPESTEDNPGANGLAIVTAPSTRPNMMLPYFEETVEFWARDRVDVEGAKKLKHVLNRFHQQEHYDTEHFHVYFSTAEGAIEDLGRDAERRKIWRVSMLFVYRDRNIV